MPVPERYAELSAADSGEPLSIDQIRVDYDGQWVLVKVTALDELSRTPLAGYVVANGRRGHVHKALSKIATSIAESEIRPAMPFYIFCAGSSVPFAPSTADPVGSSRGPQDAGRR